MPVRALEGSCMLKRSQWYQVSECLRRTTHESSSSPAYPLPRIHGCSEKQSTRWISSCFLLHEMNFLLLPPARDEFPPISSCSRWLFSCYSSSNSLTLHFSYDYSSPTPDMDLVPVPPQELFTSPQHQQGRSWLLSNKLPWYHVRTRGYIYMGRVVWLI